MNCEEFDGGQILLDMDDRIILVATVKVAAQPKLIREIGVGQREEREQDAHQHQG
jgi:hypothetical protein